MIVHLCTHCSTISCNRIAGDDTPNMIIELIYEAQNLSAEQSALLTNRGISLLSENSRNDALTALLGYGST